MRRKWFIGILTVLLLASSLSTASAKLQVTTEELEMVASLVVLEAGNQSDTGQKAVVQVVLNRLYSGRHGNTLREVVYKRGGGGSYDFTVAERIESTQPTERTLANTKAVLFEEDYVLPYYIMYFQSNRFHSGYKYAAYEKIDSHYFSYSPSDKPEDWEEDIIGPPPGFPGAVLVGGKPSSNTDDNDTWNYGASLLTPAVEETESPDVSEAEESSEEETKEEETAAAPTPGTL